MPRAWWEWLRHFALMRHCELLRRRFAGSYWLEVDPPTWRWPERPVPLAGRGFFK